MRELNKKSWPAKIKLEYFKYEDHHASFVERYPHIKTYAIVRNDEWKDHEKGYCYELYFKKESDAVLYRLAIE